MFTRILVPLDQSQQAEGAIPVAAQLARATHGEIMLTHVLVRPLDYAIPCTPGASAPPPLDDLETEAEGYLQRIADLPVLSGLRVSTDVRTGPTAIAILDTAEQHKADAIVLTTHGLTRWALGSVARHIVRHAPIPVLTLREPCASVFGAHGSPVLRALVPLDSLPLAEEAANAAARIVAALARPERQGALTLAMVVDPPYAEATYPPDTLVKGGAALYLERVAARIEHAFPDLKVTWLVLGERDVAAGLARLAEQGVANDVLAAASAPGVSDMIVMTTHGRTGVARLACGSVAERMLEITQLPLLVVHPSSMWDVQLDTLMERVVVTSTSSTRTQV